MKILIALLTLFSLSFSKQHVFMLDKYDKEIALEAKIVSKIANDSLDKRVKIYIPYITDDEKKIYSKYFDIADDCKVANFIFDKKGISKDSCKGLDKLYFTNNYRKLISDKSYFGAFFWNKSRPNLVFIQGRLDKKNIKLSTEYQQYIEDIDDK